MIPSDVLVPLASVIGSVLLFVGVLVTALRRKPVEVQDLWTRNDALQGQMDKLRSDFDAYRKEKERETLERDEERTNLRKVINIIGDGFDSAWAYVGILRTALHTAGIDVPEPSAYVIATTEAARTARAQLNERTPA